MANKVERHRRYSEFKPMFWIKVFLGIAMLNSSNFPLPFLRICRRIYVFREVKSCSKRRKCGKRDKHSGRRDTNRKIHAFWETSRFQLRNTLKREFRESDQQLRADYERKTARFADLENRKEEVYEQECQAGLYFELF